MREREEKEKGKKKEERRERKVSSANQVVSTDTSFKHCSCTLGSTLGEEEFFSLFDTPTLFPAS